MTGNRLSRAMTADLYVFDKLPTELQTCLRDRVSRTLCPKCGGGSSAERSLSITYQDTIKLSCWRATCSWYAYVIDDERIRYQGKKMREARPYREPTIPLQGEPLAILKRDYGLSQTLLEAHGWRLTENGEALVMPIRDRYGGELGHVTRTLSKQKRVMTYKATAKPFLDVWFTSPDSPWVVVEDCLSAARLMGCGINAVALLGTNISAADAKELNKITGGNCYLALDNDAWDKALKWSQRHAHILTMRPVPLTLDIKDFPDDKIIKDLFGALNGWNAAGRCGLRLT